MLLGCLVVETTGNLCLVELITFNFFGCTHVRHVSSVVITGATASKTTAVTIVTMIK